ncbi:MAG: hypothetical protein DRH11_07610 [Deltaproteobacteria bacterium]|nr:MAG: hypothetical protein DRH11_07610 [Deltaproteobacteria bacterium]
MFDEDRTVNPDAPGFYDGQELLGISRKPEEPQVDLEQEEVKTKLEQFELLKKHLGDDGIESLLEDARLEEEELERRLKEDPEYANRIRNIVTKVDTEQLRSLDQKNYEKAMEIIEKDYPHLKGNLLEVKAFWERANRLNPRGVFEENVRLACENATVYLGMDSQVARKKTSNWVEEHHNRLWMIRRGGKLALKEEKEGKRNG